MAIKTWHLGASRADQNEETWSRSQTIAQGLPMRARIVLCSARDESIRELAERLGVSQPTVCLWRRRCQVEGVAGQRNGARSGRRRRITSAKKLAAVNPTVRKAKTATHWSARRLAKDVGLSHVSVHRIWLKVQRGLNRGSHSNSLKGNCHLYGQYQRVAD
jgi:transposase